MAVDSLVDSVATYNRRPTWTHAYAGPFLAFYAAWLYLWLAVYGMKDHFELGCIIVAIIGLAQVLVVLFCHWFVTIQCLLTCRKELDPMKAHLALVRPTRNNGCSELVPLKKSKMTSGKIKLWFEFQKLHYIYDEEERKEFKGVEFDTYRPMKFYQESKGLESDLLLEEAKDEYGDNHMEMDLPQFLELFKERATAPFFIFQVFCVGLWCLDEMWYYSLFTLMMLVTFEATLVKQQLKNMTEIRNMGNKPYMIYAYRNKRWNRLKSDQLLPSDIVSICRCPDERAVPCDLLLLRGPCIVDESMLTGESVPQMKEPVQELEKDRYLDLAVDSRLHILSGGTRVVQHSSPPKNESGLKAPDGGCVCYVLRTGFNTSQGKLLRTILFGVKRVTANNIETFAFILFLLIFAVAASAYVWIKGSEDEERNRYKLFLECTLILTSVVPPELPIELSLAVNNSLIALQRLGVFCTEPFRIPFAGKIDVCCFDKTGTLTSDNLVVEGIAGLGEDDNGPIGCPSDVREESIQVLVSCHALTKLDEELVGDPLEKACLTWAEWNLTKNDTAIPRRGKMQPLKIFHRFHFTSALKRMTVIAGYMLPGTSDTKHIVTVKGAPETLKIMFEKIPNDYDKMYQKLTRQGARVLALGKREIGSLTHQEIRELKRENVENGLIFAGFVVISCPLKPDSKVMLREIIDSSHKVVMITGDNPLTACHVAKVLRFSKSPKETVILDGDHGKFKWMSVDGNTSLAAIPEQSQLKQFFNSHEFCITGSSFEYLINTDYLFFRKLLLHVKIFARMAPKQKERIITELKSASRVTLMCGDGTNDVGALKHADVGVALLSHPSATGSQSKSNIERDISSNGQTENIVENSSQIKDVKKGKSHNAANAVARRSDAPAGARQRPQQAMVQTSKKLETLMKQMEEEEKAQIVRLGDASIAAPFASKISSIQSICHVIKQGRCTLVTTLQMFKILALNALVLAYSQSVLYLDGIKFSDSQATIQGLLLAACFLFVSRSKPLKTLARQRPMPNIFNVYTLLTVTSQFAVHFSCLMYLVQEAHFFEPKPVNKMNLNTEFKPSILNTTVYIMSVALQVSTFAVNYRGQPFMESLWENKAMLYSLIFSGGSIFALAAGVAPEISEKFELVPLPSQFRNIVLSVLAVDLGTCYVIDRILNFIFGDVRPS